MGLSERANEEFVRAENFERALSELGEGIRCLEDRPGAGRCTATAYPAGAAFVAGHDHNDTPVLMRHWSCADGHRYQVEVPVP